MLGLSAADYSQDEASPCAVGYVQAGRQGKHLALPNLHDPAYDHLHWIMPTIRSFQTLCYQPKQSMVIPNEMNQRVELTSLESDLVYEIKFEDENEHGVYPVSLK
jgi:hypothetical protein